MKHIAALCLAAAVFLFSGIHADAQDGSKRLTLTPTRIVVDARERSGELTVMNVFSDVATYRVQIENDKMRPEGGYDTLSAPLDAAFDPAQYVRLTPRQFTLEPKGSQRVRLSIRRPADLPAGDYRFHVMVTRLANMDPMNESNKKGVSLGINTSIGIAIPVVVRQGQYNGDVKIESAEIIPPTQTEKNAILVANVKRIGNYDIFGGMRVYWQPQNGERVQIGEVNNTNVFHEVDTRKIQFALSGYPQGPGKVIVDYVEDFYKQGVIDELILDR